ncbi:MAG TPA: PIN domain-containing protein [Verrucomicrobiae bacterium]|nr:PIN domain-containing protein [Verrucomicrobiae bacterium]
MDSSIFIYQLEADPKYVALSDVVFSWLGDPASRAVTAAITMTEILIPHYRNSDQRLVDDFYAIFSTYPNLEWVPIGLEVADIAARVRAHYQLRTPDALHAAAALHAHATALITNDAVFRRVPGFESVVLDDYI